jgi:hypothetical protein
VRRVTAETRFSSDNPLLAAISDLECYNIVLIDSLWFTRRIKDDAPGLIPVISTQRSNIMRSKGHE